MKKRPSFIEVFSTLMGISNPENDVDAEIKEYADAMELQQHRKLNIPKAFYPGTYQVDNASVTINTKQAFAYKTLVFFHEAEHARLGQLHYGELIRRMEYVATFLLYFKLELIRTQTINQILVNEFGEKWNSLENLKKVGSDQRIRERIRVELGRDTVFMEALNLLNNIEKKKLMLLLHWKKTQEGGAYWRSMKALERLSQDLDEQNKIELIKLIKQIRKKLRNATDHNGEGFRLIEQIEAAWGENAVSAAVTASLSPDVTQISLLFAGVSEVERLLTTTCLSPDLRLHKICQISNESPTPPTFQELRKILDPNNPNSNLSVTDFNKFFSLEMARPELVAIMNKLNQRVGARAYNPIQLPDIGGLSSAPFPPFTVLENDQGEVVYSKTLDQALGKSLFDKLLKRNQEEKKIPSEFSENFAQYESVLSERKTIFLQTMRREGLIND